MLKLMEVSSTPQLDKLVVIYADTKTEVPATAAEMDVPGMDFEISMGSIVYTASFEKAMLNSDGNWVWKE